LDLNDNKILRLLKMMTEERNLEMSNILKELNDIEQQKKDKEKRERERRIEYQKEYHKRNKEKSRQYCREYYRKNRESILRKKAEKEYKRN